MLVHIGWAVSQLREPDGFFLAPVQEALLQCFGGHAFASALDRQSDFFRPEAPRSPSPNNTNADPAGLDFPTQLNRSSDASCAADSEALPANDAVEERIPPADAALVFFLFFSSRLFTTKQEVKHPSA